MKKKYQNKSFNFDSFPNFKKLIYLQVYENIYKGNHLKDFNAIF